MLGEQPIPGHGSHRAPPLGRWPFCCHSWAQKLAHCVPHRAERSQVSQKDEASPGRRETGRGPRTEQGRGQTLLTSSPNKPSRMWPVWPELWLCVCLGQPQTPKPPRHQALGCLSGVPRDAVTLWPVFPPPTWPLPRTRPRPLHPAALGESTNSADQRPVCFPAQPPKTAGAVCCWPAPLARWGCPGGATMWPYGGHISLNTHAHPGTGMPRSA